MSQLDEFGLIRHLTARVPSSNRFVRVGIGDDAAVLEQSEQHQQLLSTDAMVEGVHFLQTTLSWRDVGYKAVTVSVSDIAAMGGDARHLVLSLAIPKHLSLQDLESIYDGVADACTQYDCSLVGGDVVKTDGPLVITSTILGSAPPEEILLRSGAKPGDVVFVTGHLGGSAAGLAALTSKSVLPPDERMTLAKFHQRPQAQVTAGRILGQERASSCNDVSDGLASELNEIAQASEVRLRIQTDRIPMAPETRNLARVMQKDALEFAWNGGEDYQLVGTAAPMVFARVLARCESVGISIQQIGRVEQGEGVVAEFPDGHVEHILPQGYNHFKSLSK